MSLLFLTYADGIAIFLKMLKNQTNAFVQKKLFVPHSSRKLIKEQIRLNRNWLHIILPKLIISQKV